MEVVLNGVVTDVDQEMNLWEFLLSKELNLETIIVEHNEVIVKKQEWKTMILQDKDRLEVLKFVGGG
ncbi:sulfur carrier protein ThiS [Pelosinus propionicus]|uniref:Sulfur carrier protein n=1 Tax=Pelosinus propionicus DSM 13327 TaxID=1123291 RepID=A0A1I4PY83_9FIRM|nr:sulfur carrier protein ThiS [Pelosinus propionicus]SFM32400.1 sulfur carrier protein [Pelosinus propionicus DSM 13327]